MKTIVLYDSNYGNTKLIAGEIARNISNNTKAISIKNYKNGDLNSIDLLILGSPINGWTATKGILEFLQSNKSDIKKVLKFTTFDTRVKLFIHGDAKDKMAKTLKSIGPKLVIAPKAFYVKATEGPLFEGELQKAAEWAKAIAHINE